MTDFGMARLSDLNPQATHFTNTMCPGTDVYMPPEAVQDKPVYTEKIDCFSFGVITVQILTRRFPEPGDRRKEIQINHPGLPSGKVEVLVPEAERRQNHISRIDPNDTFLPIALNCLKDEDVERPLAQQLCGRVAALKESPEYYKSAGGGTVRVREQAQQGQGSGLQQTIQSQISHLEETIIRKGQALRQKDETIAAGQQQLRQQLDDFRQLEKEKNQVIEERERQLEESEQVIAQLQRRIAEIEQQRQTIDTTKQQSSRLRTRTTSNANIVTLTWREGERAPCMMSSAYSAAVDGNALYVRLVHKQVYAYTVSTSTWSQLPDSPTHSCPSVVIHNLFTLIGGKHGDSNGAFTNKLYSLTGVGSGRTWTEKFPPMPSKRAETTALCTGTALIVVGRSTVEVMNIETFQWSTAANLPWEPPNCAPAAVCGDHVYILSPGAMCSCSVSTVIQSRRSMFKASPWKRVAAPNLIGTTCVSFHGRLLTIGGRDLKYGNPTTAIHMYSPTTNSWEVISHMATPRWNCIAAVLPNHQLIVVGGMIYTSDYSTTNSVELAAIN